MLPGEIIDATFLSAAALDAFLAETLEAAKADDVLYSVHLKATMMKVSDPIIFGHVVKAYFADVFDNYGDKIAEGGPHAPTTASARSSPGSPAVEGGDEIAAAITAGLERGPRLSYTNSDKGLTNLHVPSDVIVDASMPALIRNGGKLWGVDGGEDDTLAVIPDSSYAGVFQTVIDDVNAHGPLDPATIGSVPNVGLMAQAAEEYGSHDKTFEIDVARRRAGARRRRRGAPRARRAAGRHLARDPDEGHRDPRLGEARRHARPRERRARRVLARRDALARRGAHREGEDLPRRARHRGPHDRDPRARPRRPSTRSTACARARTPSR